jgi:Rod binding domain-containing protein
MSGELDIQAAASVAGAQIDRLAQGAKSLAAKSKGDAKSSAEVPGQFSKLLATMLVKEMRQALPEGFFGEGTGSDIFDGWLDEHLGAALAQRDGLRIEGMLAHSMQSKLDAQKASGDQEPDHKTVGERP